MKRIYFSMLMMFMCISSILAADVKVTMNTVSTTMSLADKATGTAVEVGEPASKVYTFTAPAGTYVLTAYATDGTTVNGTIEIDVKEGASNEFSVITCTAYATNSGWTADADYTVVANVASKFGDTRVQTVGNSSTAGRKTFLALNGDSYNAELIPSATHEAEGYMTLYKGGTLTANVNVNGAIAMGGDYTITVPADASVYLGIKLAHFAPFKTIEANDVKTEGGNKVYTYRLASGQQYNFRTWKSGGLTQGGIFYYNTDATKCPTLAFSEADYSAKSPKFIDHDVKSNGGYNVADIYLNINPQNHLKMNVGDKKDVTGFRTWQVIESITNNYFLDPDYHYTLQSLTPGKSVDDIVLTERTDTNTDQWSTFTAVGKGTVLVTVTYDAIGLNQYDNTGKKSPFVGGEYWSAIWPENTGVFVVTVGEDAAGITPNFLVGNNHQNVESEKLAGNNVDADFDVFYYKKGEAGYAYTFKPEGAASVKVAYPTIGENAATYAGFGTEGVTDNGDGSYTVLLKQGRQIVALYDAAGNAQYQVLNAKEVEVSIENASRPGATDFMLGETVDVKFATLYHSAHKLAGIHNFTATVDYHDIPEGTSIKTTGNQYLFQSNEAAQKVSVTLPSTGVAGVPVTVGGGAIKVTGFGDPIGNHRNTSRSAGRNANFTAVQHTCYFGVLPELAFDVDIKQIPLTFNGVTGMTVALKSANGTALSPNADGTYTLAAYGTYSYEATATGYGTTRSSVVVSSDEAMTVDVELPVVNDKTWDGSTVKEPATDANGNYVISTGYELAWLSANSNGKSAVLTDDIDLAGFTFTPIGLATASAFNGTFDGQGHSVKNLYVNRTAANAGLFGYINAATIKNLSVYGEVNGTASAAGIAGYVNGACTFENVANYANVNATTASSYVAGIAGNVRAAATTITNAMNAGTITGVNYVGGIYNYYTTAANAAVTNVLNVGVVNGTQTGAIRGLTSATATTGKITNAYAPKAYFNDTKTTIVSATELASGKVAYLLGEAFGQEIGVDAYPVLGGMKVLYDEVNDKYYNEQTAPAIADFEDCVLNPSTGLYQPEDEENETAYWNSGDYTFSTYCDDWGTSGKYFYDFAVTNSTSSAYTGLADQYNSAAGGAKNGSNYAVWYDNFYGSEGMYCPDVMQVSGFYVTNTAWAVDAILNGDGMSVETDGTKGQPFGYKGAEDKLTLVVTGYDEELELTGTVEYTLAEVKDNTLYYVKDWRWVDLTSLGDNVVNVQFAINSTKTNEWGGTTPKYFCMDDFGGAAPETDAEMATKDITDIATGIATVPSAAARDNALRFNFQGQRVKASAKGIIIVNGRKHIRK